MSRGGRVLPAHGGKGLGNSTPSFFGVAGRCSVEASFYTTVKKESFCSSLVLRSGHGQWNEF